MRWVLPFAAGAIVAALSTPVVADARQDCLSQKDSDLRIDNCSDAIRLDPKDAVAYHNRGAAYVSRGELDRGIADYTKAIELNPTYGDAYNGRGFAYASKGDYVRAVADVTRANELTPKKASQSKAKTTFPQPRQTEERKAVVARASAPKTASKQVNDDVPKPIWTPNWIMGQD